MTSQVYNRAFWNEMRKRNGEASALNEGSDGYGAYVVPDEFYTGFTTALEKENLFRRFGTVIRLNVADGNIVTVVSKNDAKWVGSGTAIPDSNDDFEQKPIHSYKLAALTRIKKTFVEDNLFLIEDYLRDEFARRFARSEESAFLNGSGNDEPYGILHDAQGAETDVTTTGADIVAYDDMLRLFFSLKAEYRRNAVWLMSDETALHLRMLKDSTGRYLWRDSDDTILGRPVLTSPYMPGMTVGAKPVVFGDLRFFWIIERQRLSVKVLSELFIQEGQVGFAASERLDGRLIRREAVKVLKLEK